MNGLTLLIVIVAGAVVVSLWRAYYYPIQRCTRCKGRVTGSGWGSTSKAFNRRCRACGSTGQRVRPLSRFLHAAVSMPIRERKGD